MTVSVYRSIDQDCSFWRRTDNNSLHREDGPAIEYSNGAKEWYINNRLHRSDGPAIEWQTGHKEWYVNGHLHRLDGPAVIYADGTSIWYVDGEYIEDPKFLDFIINKKSNI